MTKRLAYLFLLIINPISVLNSQTVKDIDGNVYLAVSIGNQIWMEENLKTTKFNDGTVIPLVSDQKLWRDLKTPGYCYYDNKPENKNIYGALYNFNAVKTGKLCPAGWHVPTLDDWKSLVYFLGDVRLAGNKLKESGLDHWKNAILKPTNEFDFTALPGGMRLYSVDDHHIA